MYARHVVKLFLNLLSIYFRLSLALLIALDPRSQPHLNDRDPYYVAAVIYVPVELIDLVEHPFVVFLSHPHVLLDHLYLFLEGLDLDVIDFVVKFPFLVLLEFNHLILSHLTLNLIYHFQVEFALKVLLAEHGNDILEIVFLEAVIGRDLQV